MCKQYFEMGKWAIFDKNGKQLHESITEYNGDGKIVYQDTLEYSGKWMGECYITVSVKSPYPINFSIGDYIEYRDERFTINYDPTVIKKARRGTYGEGFFYDSIKFSSDSNELTEIMFHDWVLSDNNLHYTSLPNFSFYCKDVDDLVDRLQANTDRWCKANGYEAKNYWMFYTLKNNTDGTSDSGQTPTAYHRTLQRAADVLDSAGISATDNKTEYDAFNTAVQKQWESIYGTGDSYKDSRDDERYDRNITVSSQTVWDMMANIKSQFGLNFIIRGRNVYVGTAGTAVDHMFKYGKGNGLYEIQKRADQDQKVITKLHAYGSNDNLPTRYYADLNIETYAAVSNVTSVLKVDNLAVCNVKTDLKFSTAYFKNHYADEATLYSVRVSIGDYVSYLATVSANVDNYTDLVVRIKLADDKTDTTTIDANFAKVQAAVIKDAKVIFLGGVNKGAWPSDHMTANTKNLPDNMAVNFLMLPGFPNNALNDICRAEYDSSTDTTKYYITKPNANGTVPTTGEVLFHTEEGNHVVTFSKNQYDPYIVSPNAETIGIKEGDISCTEENDDNGLKKVYPTIEEMTDQDAGTGSTGTRLDAVVSADKIEDNGVWPQNKTTEVPGFNIYIPNLGFELDEAAEDAGGSEAKIAMKNGFCGGRTFDIANITKQDDGTWKLNCKRTADSDLDLWFPYSYAASVSDVDESMTNAYQIVTGDHFVLTGIEISDVNYVWAASVKLLRKAIHWLCDNDYTRYVYEPKIDEIYMAWQNVAAETDTTETTKSLYKTIKEGDLLLFSDDDLKLNGTVYIDQLNIKENGNKGIPTYEVTLRDEVAVGTIQRIQNTVDSLKTDVETGNVGGSVVSASQIDSFIKIYGAKYFLSRLRDDIASGVITFSAGLKIIDSLIDTLRKKGETLSGSDTAVLSEAKLIEAFLRKDQDDSTPYNITAGSLTSDRVTSTNYNSGETDGTGWGLTVDSETGKSRLEVDNLLVRMKAVFQELEIRKRTYTGGNVILSGAGSQIAAVVALNKDGLLLSGLNLFSDSTGYYIYIGSSFLAVGSDKVASGTDSQDAYTYRCYILADDGTTRTRNLWQVGDQAICQTFNIEEGHHDGVQNRYYWRLVTGVSAEAVELDDGTYYDYVDLAAVKEPEITIDGATKTYQGYDTATMTDGSGNAPKEGTTGDVWVDTPQKGDQIVQLGSQIDPDTRGNAILLDTMGTDAPSIKEYAGIKNFSLSGCLRTKLSPAGNRFISTDFTIVNAADDETGSTLYDYINSSAGTANLNALIGQANDAISTTNATVTANKKSADDAISATNKTVADNKTATDKAISETNATVAANKTDADNGIKEAKEAAKAAQDTADTVSANLTQFTDEQNQVLTGTFELITDDDGNAILDANGKKQYRLIATSGLITKPDGSGIIYSDENGNVGTLGVKKLNDDAGTLAYINADNIHLEGLTTINNGFSIGEDGIMTANGAIINGSGTFKGAIEAESGTFRGYLRSAVETIDTTVAPFNDNNVKCYLVSEKLNLLAKNPCCIYLPCDEKYIGARVIIVSTPAFMSNGTFTGDADTAMVRIYAGRTYTDTLYWNASDDNFLADETAAYKTKSAYNSCYHFLGWSYIQDNIHYLPEGIELWNGYIELLGVPAVATDGQTFNKITNTDLSDYVTINADGTISETTAFSADKLTHSTEAATFCQWMVIGHTAAEFHYLDDTNKNLN